MAGKDLAEMEKIGLEAMSSKKRRTANACTKMIEGFESKPKNDSEYLLYMDLSFVFKFQKIN